MTGVNDNTLHILQHGLENTNSMYRATLSCALRRRNCGDEPTNSDNCISDEKSRRDRNSDTIWEGYDNNYDFEKRMCNMLAPGLPKIRSERVEVQ